MCYRPPIAAVLLALSLLLATPGAHAQGWDNEMMGLADLYSPERLAGEVAGRPFMPHNLLALTYSGAQGRDGSSSSGSVSFMVLLGADRALDCGMIAREYSRIRAPVEQEAPSELLVHLHGHQLMVLQVGISSPDSCPTPRMCTGRDALRSDADPRRGQPVALGSVWGYLLELHVAAGNFLFVDTDAPNAATHVIKDGALEFDALDGPEIAGTAHLRFGEQGDLVEGPFRAQRCDMSEIF